MLMIFIALEQMRVENIIEILLHEAQRHGIIIDVLTDNLVVYRGRSKPICFIPTP